MDGTHQNANNAESGGEANPSAGGKADGRFPCPDEFSVKEKGTARRGVPRWRVSIPLKVDGRNGGVNPRAAISHRVQRIDRAGKTGRLIKPGIREQEANQADYQRSK